MTLPPRHRIRVHPSGLPSRPPTRLPTGSATPSLARFSDRLPGPLRARRPGPLRALLLALLPAVLLSSCGGGGDAGARDRPVVGFSQTGAESSWRTAETQSIRSEAEARGIELKFADAQGRQEKQIQDLKSFVAQGVDAILLAPKVETGWEPVLREIQRARIPVVLVDRGVTVEDPSLYATLIAADFVEEGRTAARWLVAKTGGKANVVELEGSPGSSPALDRHAGFAEVLARHADMKVIASQTGDFNRAKGKEVMEALIKAHRERIDAVYAHNDDMALGAIQALDEAGMKPGDEVIVVSIDAVKGAFEAMAKRQLNATVECNPLLGPQAFDAVQAILARQPVEKRIVVPGRLYEQAEAAAELPKRRY